MYSKVFVLLFALFTINSIDCGSIKYAQLMKQPPSVQALVNDLLFQSDNTNSQFELLNWKISTTVNFAKINSKLTLKHLQATVKANKDDLVCGGPAQVNAKLIERELDGLKTCQPKEEAKQAKSQITAQVKILTNQAYTVSGSCSLLHTVAEEAAECVEFVVGLIRSELERVTATSEESIAALAKKGEDCVQGVVEQFEADVAQIVGDLDYCQNPTEAPIVIEDDAETNKPEQEGEDQGNTGEEVAPTEGNQEGDNNDEQQTEVAESQEQEGESGNGQETEQGEVQETENENANAEVEENLKKLENPDDEEEEEDKENAEAEKEKEEEEKEKEEEEKDEDEVEEEEKEKDEEEKDEEEKDEDEVEEEKEEEEKEEAEVEEEKEDEEKEKEDEEKDEDEVEEEKEKEEEQKDDDEVEEEKEEEEKEEAEVEEEKEEEDKENEAEDDQEQQEEQEAAEEQKEQESENQL